MKKTERIDFNYLRLVLCHFRRYLLNVHNVVNVFRTPHRCWETSENVALLNGPLRMYGCLQCGRTHICRALAYLEPEEADERVLPDPCPLIRTPDAEYICPFSGTVVDAGGRTNAVLAATFEEMADQRNTWRSDIHSDESNDEGEDEYFAFDRESFGTRPDFNTSRRQLARAHFQTEDKVLQHAIRAMESSHRLNKVYGDARRLDRWLQEAKGPQLAEDGTTEEEILVNLTAPTRKKRSTRTLAQQRVDPYRAQVVPARSKRAKRGDTPHAGPTTIDNRGNVNLGPIIPAPRDLHYWSWFVFTPELPPLFTIVPSTPMEQPPEQGRKRHYDRFVPKKTKSIPKDTRFVSLSATSAQTQVHLWYRRHEKGGRPRLFPSVQQLFSEQWISELQQMLKNFFDWAPSTRRASFEAYMDRLMRWTRLVFSKRPALSIRPLLLLSLYFLDLGRRTIEINNGAGETIVIMLPDRFALELHENGRLVNAFMGTIPQHNERVRKALGHTTFHSVLDIAMQQSKKRLISPSLSGSSSSPPAKKPKTSARAITTGSKKGGIIGAIFLPKSGEEVIPTVEPLNGIARTMPFAPDTEGCTLLQIHQLRDAYLDVVQEGKESAAWYYDWFHHERWQCFPFIH